MSQREHGLATPCFWTSACTTVRQNIRCSQPPGLRQFVTVATGSSYTCCAVWEEMRHASFTPGRSTDLQEGEGALLTVLFCLPAP